MKIAIHSLKNDHDGKVPTLKKDIVAYYTHIKGCKDDIVNEYNGYSVSDEINGWIWELLFRIRWSMLCLSESVDHQ